MSRGNVYFELEHGLPAEKPSTTPNKIICVDDATYDKVCIFGYIGGAPGTYAVASQGYTKDFAKGCILIDTANAAPYSNKGTVSAPSWTVLS